MDISKILVEFATFVEEGAQIAASAVPDTAPIDAAIAFFAEVVKKAAENHLAITGEPMDPSLITQIERVPENGG